MKSVQSILGAAIRLPFEVYLTLYVRVVLLASKKNPRDAAKGLATGLTTVLQVILIMAVVNFVKGTLAELGKLGVIILFVCLFGINHLILHTMKCGDSFEARFASISVARRLLLDVLAASWIVLVITAMVLSVPPIPPQPS